MVAFQEVTILEFELVKGQCISFTEASLADLQWLLGGSGATVSGELVDVQF